MNRFVFRFATVAVAAGVMSLPGMAQTSDNSFITKAMESNYSEVRLGCLAQSKAQDPQVKDFATMMIDDHSQALQRLRPMNGTATDATTNASVDATNERDMTVQNGTSVDRCQAMSTDQGTQSDKWGQLQMASKDQDLYNRLSKLSGPGFDREYINAMVDDHKKDVREFEREAGMSARNNDSDISRQKPDSGTDSRAIAREMLPTLQKHLQAAENIQRQLQH